MRASGRMTCSTARVNGSGQVEKPTLVTSSKARCKDTASKPSRMDPSTKARWLTIRRTERVNLLNQTARNTSEILLMVKGFLMASEKKSWLMVRRMKETSKEPSDTARASAPTPADRSMTGTGSTARSTAKAPIPGQVEQPTPGTSWIQPARVRVFTNILMEQSTKANGWATKDMDKELTPGQKVTSMLASTLTESLRDKVLLPGPTVADMKASGKTAIAAESVSTLL